MITLRPASSRAHIVRPFIDTRRTFSFPPYFDARYRNYGNLQTINDDRVQHAWQVPWHEHKNMEIFGYVVSGSSHHVDSLGNDAEVPAGAVQRMSAGRGISHTEGNTSHVPNRYLQLWIRPNQQEVEPHWSWHQFSTQEKLDRFCDITARLPIHADARFLAGIFTQRHTQILDGARSHYVYVVRGQGQINQDDYEEGTGLALWQETELEITPSTESEILWFELEPHNGQNPVNS